jgi:hypothetical protein
LARTTRVTIRGFLRFLRNVVKLPSDEFGQVLRLALGSPPAGMEPVDTVSEVTPRRAGDE